MRSLSDYYKAVYRMLKITPWRWVASSVAVFVGVLIGGGVAYVTGIGGLLSATPLGPERISMLRVDGQLASDLFRLDQPIVADDSFKGLVARQTPAMVRPKIAIVIDDLGLSSQLFAQVNALPGPLTLSFLPYAEGSQRQIDQARAAGHRVMLHLPMEPLVTSQGTYDPGPGALLSGDTAEALTRKLADNLSQFSGYEGVNNHMGSRLTQNQRAMTMVLRELNHRGLFFLDSVTSAQSKAGTVAEELGLTILERDLFLDADHGRDGAASVRAQLRKLEELALIQGQAIAIAHPHSTTLAALGPWLVTVQARGFELVPVSALVTPSANKTKAIAALR